MAVLIRFDNTHNVIEPTLVVASRSGIKRGIIPATNTNVSDVFNSKFDLSFTVAKNDVTPEMWDQIENFKLCWCSEWDVWFEMYVEKQEEDSIIKNVTCVSLCEAELGQIMVYDFESNTEDDIAREDWVPRILWTPSEKVIRTKTGESYTVKPEQTLLGRLLDKAPHYTVGHVDSSIADKQREFSFNGTSIYDALQDIAEEFDCIVVFDSGSDADGNIKRSFSLYDLEYYCRNCGHRSVFEGPCSECGSTDIQEPYGDDTNIYVNTENLAANITYTTDTGSVKNCFRLSAGDELMTAAVVAINPTQSNYIYYFTDEMKSDMSNKLRKKLDEYTKAYDSVQDERVFEIDAGIVNSYNALVRKYQSMDDTLSEISTPITGYKDLMTVYYEAKDFEMLLDHTMMPSVETQSTNATAEANNLYTKLNGTQVPVRDYSSSTSRATATSAVEFQAKTIVDARYKVSAVTSSITYSGNTWSGQLTITNFSDDEDTDTTVTISVTMVNNAEKYVKQQIDYVLKKKNEEKSAETAYSIMDIFNLESLADFKTRIKSYSIKGLTSFYNAGDACLSVIDKEYATYSSDPNSIYVKVYVPYHNKLMAVESELKEREDDLAVITGIYDENDTVEKEGLLSLLDECRQLVADQLNMKDFFGETLWKELCSYRREGEYKNDNFVSDGKDSAQLLDEAQEYMEQAEKELYKSATMQHSISSTLKNLLVMKEFEPLIQNFKVGNWIRIRVDEKIYKLRLISYSIDFENPESFNVEFSDVKEYMDGIKDAESIFNQAASMATSFTAVTRQASKGKDSSLILNDWFERGMSATLTNIVNSATDQDVKMDEFGLLCRHYYPVSDDYDDHQLKIINNGMYLTDDNWRSLRTAVGKIIYRDNDTGNYVEGYGVNAETIVGQLIIGEQLKLYNINNTMKFDEDGLEVSGSNNTKVVISPNATNGVFEIRKNNSQILGFDSNGNLNITGKITANSLLCGATTGSSYLRWENSALTIKAGSLYCGSENDTNYIKWENNQLTIKGSLNATSGSIGRLMITDYITTNSNRTEYNDMWHGGLTITPAGIGATGYNTYFTLSAEGQLTAINANVRGTITADTLTCTNGTIANFHIGPSGLSGGTIVSSSGNNTLTISGAKIDFGTTLDAVEKYGIEFSKSGTTKAAIWFNTSGNNAGLEIKATDIDALDTIATFKAFNGKICNYYDDYRFAVGSSPNDNYHCDTIACQSGGKIYFYGGWGDPNDQSGRYVQTTTSDARLKTAIKDSSVDALSVISKIRHREFKWIDGDYFDIGYIAQELEEINPHLVAKPISENDYYGINTFYLDGLITRAIQQLSDENKKLKKELREIKEKL